MYSEAKSILLLSDTKDISLITLNLVAKNLKNQKTKQINYSLDLVLFGCKEIPTDSIFFNSINWHNIFTETIFQKRDNYFKEKIKSYDFLVNTTYNFKSFYFFLKIKAKKKFIFKPLLLNIFESLQKKKVINRLFQRLRYFYLKSQGELINLMKSLQ